MNLYSEHKNKLVLINRVCFVCYIKNRGVQLKMDIVNAEMHFVDLKMASVDLK